MNPKAKVLIHIIAQLLAQSAIVSLVPPNLKQYFVALVAVVGVFVAFSDSSLAAAGGWNKKV